MQAIILSRRDIREHDQMISLYTWEKGKVEALARGVKKILSKNSAALEPFCFVEAEIIPGKEISHLGSVTPIDIFKNIRMDLRKSLSVAYVVGLLDKITHPHEPDQRIFNLLKSWLGWLCYSADNSELSLAIDSFVIKLFFFLGFDITKVRNIPLPVRRDLSQLLEREWGVVVSDKKISILHVVIYRYAVYHSEKKLGDWGGIVKFYK